MKKNYYILPAILIFFLIIKAFFPIKPSKADWTVDFLAPTVYIELCCSDNNTSCTPYNQTLTNNECNKTYLFYRIGCNDGTGGSGCRDYGKTEVFNSSCISYPAPTRTDFLTPTPINLSNRDGENIKICASARDNAGNVRNSNSSSMSTNGIIVVGSWFKLKNTSFHNLTSRSVYVPASPLAFDSDDNTTRRLIIGAEGLVSANGSINITPPPTNVLNSYIKNNYFLIDQYKSYVETFKEHKLITALNQLENNKIHFYNGNLTISSTTDFNNKNLVLLIDGTLTISSNFQPTSSSIALLANTININSSVGQIEAILIGENISFGTSNTPLKIKGNLVAQNSVNPFTRERTDNKNRPSVFIVFDTQKYLNLLPLLSRKYYDYKISQ